MIKQTSCFVLASLISFILILSSCVTLYYGWGNKTVQYGGGDLVVSEDTRIDFFRLMNGQPVITVTLETDSKSRDLYFIVDTGYRGSCIDSSVLSQFPDCELSSYQFWENLSNNTPLEGKSYYFKDMMLGSARVERPLLPCYDLGRAGINLDLGNGKRLSGILGMNILRQHPFIFSNSEKTISFVSEKPQWSTSFVHSLHDADNRPFKIEITTEIQNEPYTFILDTGAGSSIFGEKLFSKFVDAKKPRRSRTIKTRFGSQTCGILPELTFSGSTYRNVFAFENIGCEESTIGMSILGNYDMYVDVKNSILILNPLSNQLIESWQDSKPTFGFVLGEKGYRRFVDGLFLWGDKTYLVPELSMGDELISVNGITLDKIDWTIWYQLDEADFVFRRKGKDFALHLKRQGIEGL